jgi:shikimate kinase
MKDSKGISLNLPLEHDLEDTKEKDEKEESPAESEDEMTILQQLKSFFGIQRDMSVRITSKMMIIMFQRQIGQQ